jgi:hypothetical protein
MTLYARNNLKKKEKVTSTVMDYNQTLQFEEKPIIA